MTVTIGLPLTPGELMKFPANSLLSGRVCQFWAEFDEFGAAWRNPLHFSMQAGNSLKLDGLV
jgi:hypothetical protein